MAKFECTYFHAAALDPKHLDRSYEPGKIYEARDDHEAAFMASSRWFKPVVVEGESETAEKTKTDLEAKVKGLEEKVKTLEADKASAVTAKETAEKTKTDLEAKVKGLEEKVKTLEAKK
jgi:uncharacterized protein YceH (UPF0502 family)